MERKNFPRYSSLFFFFFLLIVFSFSKKSHGEDFFPPRYQEGEKEELWVWDLNVMPPSFRKITAINRAIGRFSYIFVEKDLNHLISQDSIHTLHHFLEKEGKKESRVPQLGILALNQEIFSPLPKVINPDPRVLILFSNLGSYQNHRFNGFFNAFDQMTEKKAWEKHQQHSNETNIIYIHLEKETPIDLEHIASIIAHESQHLLSYHSGSPQKSHWLSEVQAEAAMLFNGYYTDQSAVNNYVKSSWETSLVHSSYVNYGISILFASYLIDRLKGWGGLNHIHKREQEGQRAVEDLWEEKKGEKLAFASIYKDFIDYLLEASREKKLLPESWEKGELGLHIKPFFPKEKITKIPFKMKGSLKSHSFALLEWNGVEAENLDILLHIIEDTAPPPVVSHVSHKSSNCEEKNPQILWEMVPEGLLLYPYSCSYETEKSFSYEITIRKKPPSSYSFTYPLFLK